MGTRTPGDHRLIAEQPDGGPRVLPHLWARHPQGARGGRHPPPQDRHDRGVDVAGSRAARRELSIDYDSRGVTVSGRPAKLTATEYEVLRVQSRNAGRVVTYRAAAPAAVEQA